MREARREKCVRRLLNRAPCELLFKDRLRECNARCLKPKQAHRTVPSMTSPPGDAVTGKSPERRIMAPQTKRALTMLAAASLIFSALPTGAADLPARLLVDPSNLPQIEKQAFERGAIVVYGSRTYDPVTGQPFNVQILEGGSVPPAPSGADDRSPNYAPRYIERPANGPTAGQMLNISLRHPRAGERWTIVLSGVIDPGAPARLAAELDRRNVLYSRRISQFSRG